MALTKAHSRMIEGAAVNVVDFGAVGDGVTDDTAAIQAALDSLSSSSSVESSPISVPLRSGGSIYFPKGEYKFSTFDLPSYINIIGESEGSTALIVTGGGIRPVDLSSMAYNACIRCTFKNITIRGADKTVTLFKNGDNTETSPVKEYFNIADFTFTNVIFRNAHTLMDWRGAWNIQFNKCQFRDAWLGIITDANRSIADKENVDTKCTEFQFNNCSFDQNVIPAVLRYALGFEFNDCATYRNDDTGIQWLEGCVGNSYTNGRMEGSPVVQTKVSGGILVKNGGNDIYQCILDHTSGASSEPGVGGSWTTYWRYFKRAWAVGQSVSLNDYMVHNGQDYRVIQAHTTFAGGEPDVGASWETYFVLAEQIDTDRQWATSTVYGKASARSNKFSKVGFLQDQSSRSSAFFGTVTRQTTDRFIVLDGDENTIVDKCYAINTIDRYVDVRAGSINAVIDNCNNVTVNTNTGTYFETQLDRATGNKTVYTSGNTLVNEVLQNGLHRLPINRGEVTLNAGVTTTTVTVTGLTSSHKVIVVPRNDAGATYFVLNKLYAYCTTNTVTINHPATTAGTETVVWFVI